MWLEAIGLYSLVEEHFVAIFTYLNASAFQMGLLFLKRDQMIGKVKERKRSTTKKNGFLMFNELVALGIYFISTISMICESPKAFDIFTKEMIESHNCFHFASIHID